MSAQFQVDFDREADLTSLRRFLGDGVPGVVTDAGVVKSAPDNALAGGALTQLAVTLAGTGGAVGSALMVIREWVKNKKTSIRISAGRDGGPSIEIDSANVDKVLPAVAVLLKQMLDEGAEQTGG